MNKFIKIPKTKIFERLIIIILLISLGFLLIRENYASRIINRFEGGEFVYTYDKNPNFFKETELYDYYKEKGNVVMLGNSITYQCRWDELLQRHDIINQGIGSDITEGFLQRMKYVFKTEPNNLFINE